MIYNIWKCRPNETLIISQDSNAQVGIKSMDHTSPSDNECGPDLTRGRFGNANINNKGKKLIQFAQLHNLLFAKTLFKHRYYDIWKSFHDGETFQIDHFLVRQETRNNTIDCKTTSEGTVSDHSALILKINFRMEIEKKKKIQKKNKLGKACETPT